MEPVFRCMSNGEVILKETAAARSYSRPGGRAQTGQDVHAKALAELKKKGGDRKNRGHVLGCYTLQFGKYQGVSFKWLLENALGYAAFIVVDVKKEKKTEAPLSVNKFALLVCICIVLNNFLL